MRSCANPFWRKWSTSGAKTLGEPWSGEVTARTHSEAGDTERNSSAKENQEADRFPVSTLHTVGRSEALGTGSA